MMALFLVHGQHFKEETIELLQKTRVIYKMNSSFKKITILYCSRVSLLMQLLWLLVSKKRNVKRNTYLYTHGYEG